MDIVRFDSLCLEGRGVSGSLGGISCCVELLAHTQSEGSSWAYVSELGELEWLSVLSEYSVIEFGNYYILYNCNYCV